MLGSKLLSAMRFRRVASFSENTQSAMAIADLGTRSPMFGGLFYALHYSPDDFAQCLDVGRSALPIGVEQVYRTDKGGRERCYVGGDGDTTRSPLCGQVLADHGGRLGEQWEACRSCITQASTQSVASDDECDDRDCERREGHRQCIGQVVDY